MKQTYWRAATGPRVVPLFRRARYRAAVESIPGSHGAWGGEVRGVCVVSSGLNTIVVVVEIARSCTLPPHSFGRAPRGEVEFDVEWR